MTKLWSNAILLTLLGACGPGSSSKDGGGGGGSDSPPGGSDAPACAEAIYTAEQEPTALLVVLDRSSSMAASNKWTFAAQAIVQALDQDVFDSIHVGLYAAPTGEVTGPACIFMLPVACQVPPFPQVDLALAGSDKSTAATGPRRAIKDWLTNNYPDGGIGDASPLYDGVQAALGALTAWPGVGKRILLVVTDGSISCTEFSARPGYGDCNGCTHDWENPSNLVTLVSNANADPSTPIETFIIGVPGADTYDPTACNYPPYRMRLALSAIAAAGAPNYVPAACDGRTFTEAGADPTLSCHFDMTQGGFGVEAVADAVSFIRGQTVGCIFELPEPPAGGEIDPTKVNVEYTVDGQTTTIGRRSDPSNMCLDTGCWDYTSDGKIELIGKACSDLQGASSAEVRIVTGCTTIFED